LTANPRGSRTVSAEPLSPPVNYKFINSSINHDKSHPSNLPTVENLTAIGCGMEINL
jgi:hypothetical protein